MKNVWHSGIFFSYFFKSWSRSFSTVVSLCTSCIYLHEEKRRRANLISRNSHVFPTYVVAYQSIHMCILYNIRIHSIYLTIHFSHIHKGTSKDSPNIITLIRKCMGCFPHIQYWELWMEWDNECLAIYEEISILIYDFAPNLFEKFLSF